MNESRNPRSANASCELSTLVENLRAGVGRKHCFPRRRRFSTRQRTDEIACSTGCGRSVSSTSGAAAGAPWRFSPITTLPFSIAPSSRCIRRARTFEERQAIFAGMYEELFAQVPDHPRLAAKGASTSLRERDVAWNLAQLRPYLSPGGTFLEVGAGELGAAVWGAFASGTAG